MWVTAPPRLSGIVEEVCHSPTCSVYLRYYNKQIVLKNFGCDDNFREAKFIVTS